MPYRRNMQLFNLYRKARAGNALVNSYNNRVSANSALLAHELEQPGKYFITTTLPNRVPPMPRSQKGARV